MTLWGCLLGLVMWGFVKLRSWILNLAKQKSSLQTVIEKVPIVLAMVTLVLFVTVSSWRVLPAEIQQTKDWAYILRKLWWQVRIVFIPPQ
jgi:hypothetical protein